MNDSRHTDTAHTSLLVTIRGLSLLACVCAGLVFLREVVLASAYGAGAAVDAYLVAMAVPFMIGNSIVSTLEAAFIPLYLSCKTEGGSSRAARLAGVTHVWLLAGGLATTLGLYAALPLLLPIQAPGFSVEGLATVRDLSVFTIPSIVFAGLCALGRSVLLAERRFLAPAVAPGVGASVMIAVILIWGPALGITAAAVGFTAARVAIWLTVYVPIVATGLPGRGFAWDRRNPDVTRLGRAVAPLLVCVTATSAIPVVDRLMASRFPAGVISALSYADRVVQIPSSIFVAAVATATFPALSRLAAVRDFAGLRRTFAFGVRVISALLVPAAALLWLLNHEVVAVIFRRGQFTAADAHTTAVALTGLTVGLVFMGVFQLVPRMLNALQLTTLVAIGGLLSLGFKTLFNLLFVPLFGYLGFTLATSAMYVATGTIMFWLLHRRLGGLDLSTTLPQLAKMAGCATLMLIAGAAMADLTASASPLVRLVLAGSTAGSVYVGALWLVGGRNLRTLLVGPAIAGEHLEKP